LAFACPCWRGTPPRTPFDITVNVITPYCPIMTDGKAPDLRSFKNGVDVAVEKATRRARRDAPERVEKISAKSVVLAHLDEATAKASGDGLYRFNQRQLYYVVRSFVKGVIAVELAYKNFKGIITDHEAEHGDIPGMFRDPRGALYEPHERRTTPIGTLAVEAYCRPPWTYNKVLYVEKEGSFEALKAAKWPERHDCALISSKGFTTRAVKDLLDLLAGDGEPVTVFCVHDADAAGTMIHQTLAEATRARPQARTIEIVNLGLDPWEAVEMGLELEPVERRSRTSAVARYVSEHKDGANWSAWLQRSRIELNAMTTPQLIAWLNAKMRAHAGAKVIPPAHVLEDRLHQETAEALRARMMEAILTTTHGGVRAGTA
jgi:hypothetical protein